MSNKTWALILAPALIAMSIYAWYFHRDIHYKEAYSHEAAKRNG